MDGDPTKFADKVCLGSAIRASTAPLLESSTVRGVFRTEEGREGNECGERSNTKVPDFPYLFAANILPKNPRSLRSVRALRLNCPCPLLTSTSICEYIGLI